LNGVKNTLDCAVASAAIETRRETPMTPVHSIQSRPGPLRRVVQAVARHVCRHATIGDRSVLVVLRVQPGEVAAGFDTAAKPRSALYFDALDRRGGGIPDVEDTHADRRLHLQIRVVHHEGRDAELSPTAHRAHS
jgi:hypothetical protein